MRPGGATVAAMDFQTANNANTPQPFQRAFVHGAATATTRGCRQFTLLSTAVRHAWTRPSPR